MSSIDALISFHDEEHKDQIFSLLEIETFLEEVGNSEQAAKSFTRALVAFWAEADALDRFFSGQFSGVVKPIPYEKGPEN